MTTRLGRLARGAVAKLPLPISEAQFQQQITDLAELRGWEWAHFRAARRADGSWYTPFSGPLGEGWPDLVLVRERDRRLIFAEVKRAGGKPSAKQELVLRKLRGLQGGIDRLRDDQPDGFLEVFLWRPADWAEIEAVLR